jgi:hypothetical protein
MADAISDQFVDRSALSKDNITTSFQGLFKIAIPYDFLEVESKNSH